MFEVSSTDTKVLDERDAGGQLRVSRRRIAARQSRYAQLPRMPSRRVIRSIVESRFNLQKEDEGNDRKHESEAGTRKPSLNAARPYLSSPAIRDTCIQSSNYASAPSIGAERVNLTTSPSSRDRRNSEKTLVRNGAGRAPMKVRLKHRRSDIRGRCSLSLVNHWSGGRSLEDVLRSSLQGEAHAATNWIYTLQRRSQREIAKEIVC